MVVEDGVRVEIYWLCKRCGLGPGTTLQASPPSIFICLSMHSFVIHPVVW